jgi:aspartyl-tRNA(Asn)/glutamyl-tRNA(Gln) amidotransferase subunit A
MSTNGSRPWFASVADLADEIRTKRLSPVTLVQHYLDRIDRIDPALNSFIAVTRDLAIKQASLAEREIQSGRYRGPLHGIPYALKDLADVQGLRTTAGSRIPAGIAEKDATIVRLLDEAGAILLGKTNLHEFAYGPLSTNPHYGDVRNPWDRTRHSGGSSGGSAAAVAAGLCAFAIGTDTTGSIRIPSAFCGLTGLKPTYGRVSKAGVIPLAWSLDHVGPMCRTARDAAIVLQMIAGADATDPACESVVVPDYVAGLSDEIRGLRVAVLDELTRPVDPEIATAFEAMLDALREGGVTVSRVSMTEAESSAAVVSAILYPEALSYHEQHSSRRHNYADDVRERLELGELVSATDYVKAQRARSLLIDRVNRILGSADVIACPTEPIEAPLRSEENVELDGNSLPKASVVTRLTRMFNLTGHPALTLPCGFSRKGLPLAAQLIAAPWAEAMLLRVADAYQSKTHWHTHTPAIDETGEAAYAS